MPTTATAASKRLALVEDRLEALHTAYGDLLGARLSKALDVAEGRRSFEPGPEVTADDAAAILAPVGGPSGFREMADAIDTAGEGSIPLVFAECCRIAAVQLAGLGYPAPPGAGPDDRAAV